MRIDPPDPDHDAIGAPAPSATPSSALARCRDERAALHDEVLALRRVRDDLIDVLSHELRTPLTPIIGLLEVLDEIDEHPDPLERRVRDAMGRNARRLLLLVDDLLAVALASAGRLVAHPVPVVLDPLVASLVADLELDVDVAVDDVSVLADPTHLRQILAHYLANAALYGAPPLEVRVRDGRDDRVRIEVIDHGPGVPADVVPRMWERFVQGDRGDGRLSRGVGIGLELVRLLARANGGAVAYRPGRPQGSVFVLELPRAPRAAVAGAVPAARPRLAATDGEDADITDEVEVTVEPEPRVPPTPEHDVAHRRTPDAIASP